MDLLGLAVIDSGRIVALDSPAGLAADCHAPQRAIKPAQRL
jgi:hypothetical protein